MTSRYWLFIASAILLVGTSLAADPPVTQEQALQLLRDGKRQDALHALDAIIAAKPADPTTALLGASYIDLEDGDWRAAKPYVQQLVKLRPSSFQAWEMMIQVQQAAGNRRERNDAIDQLFDCWHTALDPKTRARVSFVRDRIFGAKHTLVAQQALETFGEDTVRFVFQPVDETPPAHHLLAVRSDNQTNERWREDGTVPYGTIVYHLDSVEQLSNGQTAGRSYEFYLEPPDYDRVRAKVVEILAGTAQPMNGPADPFWAGENTK